MDELTHASVRSAYSLERELEVDFSSVRSSGRSRLIQPTPASPRPETQTDILELSPEGRSKSRLNVNTAQRPATEATLVQVADRPFINQRV